MAIYRKKVNGRKRDLVVDTLGMVVAAVVHSAGIQDRDGAKLVLKKMVGRFPRLKKIMKGRAIIDLRNVYDPVAMRQAGFDYHCVGRPDLPPG